MDTLRHDTLRHNTLRHDTLRLESCHELFPLYKGCVDRSKEKLQSQAEWVKDREDREEKE